MTSTPPVERRSRLERTLRVRPGRLPDELGILIALIVLIGVIALARPGFLLPSNLLLLVRGAAFFGIIALGMVFLMAQGDIDLSVGSQYYLTSIATALLITNGLDPWLAAGLGILLGALLGAFNGLIALAYSIPVLIVTLGTLSLYRGIGLVISGARVVVVPEDESPFYQLAGLKLFDFIPTPAVLFVGLAIILHILLQRTKFGYRVQSIGSNLDAARLAGIPIALTRMWSLILLGALCGLAGVLSIGFFGAADATVGTGFELLVVSAVIIGGTPLTGGSGTVIGAMLGVLIIVVINSGIVQLGVSSQWSSFVTGVVILVAIGLDRLIRRRREARAESSGYAA
jgi:ribose transport system permease protein